MINIQGTLLEGSYPPRLCLRSCDCLPGLLSGEGKRNLEAFFLPGSAWTVSFSAQGKDSRIAPPSLTLIHTIEWVYHHASILCPLVHLRPGQLPLLPFSRPCWKRAIPNPIPQDWECACARTWKTGQWLPRWTPSDKFSQSIAGHSLRAHYRRLLVFV